jgi:integrase
MCPPCSTVRRVPRELERVGLRRVGLHDLWGGTRYAGLKQQRELIEYASCDSDLVQGTTKNHQRRSVPIRRFLADQLAEHLVGKKPDDLVFTSPAGGVLRNTNFRPRFFDPAAERVGLAGLTPHELRHTAGLAVQAGANVKVVQQMLGHASTAMTLDVYAGLFADNSMRSRTVSIRPLPAQMRTRCGPEALRRL